MMRDEPDLERLSALSVLPPGASPELLELFCAALDGGRLGTADWLTLRDLREISGHRDFTIQALLLALFSALSDGNLCLSLSPESLKRRLIRLGVAEASAALWAGQIASGFRIDAYPGLVASAPGEFAPLVVQGSRIFFQRHHAWGEILAARLRERLTAPLPEPPRQAALEAILHEILCENPLHLGGKPAVLGEEQRRALILALTRPLLLVSGGPGTGKTALVASMLRGFLRLGFEPERILLSAPTGRAARNLSDFLKSTPPLDAPAAGSPDEGLARVESGTLHRLLGFNPSRGTFAHGPDSQLRADLVIIDEVSMVDAILMGRLLEALPGKARLILLGDKDQLPSVEAGALLADLIPPTPSPGQGRPGRENLVILRRNYRSQADILEVAERINAQDPDVIRDLPRRNPNEPAWPRLEEWRGPKGTPGGCWFIRSEGNDPGALHRLLAAWAERHFLSSPGGNTPSFLELVRAFAGSDPAGRMDLLAPLLGFLGRARILTVIRRSPWGSEALGRRLADLLRPRLDPSGTGATFAGAPIMITRNDHARRLYNGDVGLLLRQGRDLSAFFQAGAGFVGHALGLLPPWEPAWASTVHKAQGSEYDQVLLVAPPQGAESLLTKEILYTGITRARSLAVLHGPRAVLESAVARRVERESGLELWG